jgi:hypothetical protein
VRLGDLDWAKARMVPPDRYEGAIRVTRAAQRAAARPVREFVADTSG